MDIKLNDDEVRAALVKAVEEKTNYIYGSINADDCGFEVINSRGQVDDIEEVRFIAFNVG